MSNQEDKEKRSKRLHKEQAAIVRQAKIAKQHGVDPLEIEREPHRFAKHKAMDCGTPGCFMCGNPRHKHKHGESIQEKSFTQTQQWNED